MKADATRTTTVYGETSKSRRSHQHRPKSREPPPRRRTLGRRPGRRGRPGRARGGEGRAASQAAGGRDGAPPRRRGRRLVVGRRKTRRTAARRGARGRAGAGAAHQVERQVHQGGGDGVLALEGGLVRAQNAAAFFEVLEAGWRTRRLAARRAAPRGLPPAVHGGARARGALLAVGAPRLQNGRVAVPRAHPARRLHRRHVPVRPRVQGGARRAREIAVRVRRARAHGGRARRRAAGAPGR